MTSPTWQYTSLDRPRSHCAPQRAEDRQRHAEQDDERQHQALVLRRQRQVHEEQRQAEDDERLLAGLDLLERDARPRVAHALRQRAAGAMRSIACSAWPELTPGAAEPLIVAERNRLKWLMTCGAVVSLSVTTLLERHHLAGSRPRVELLERLRVRTELLVGLHVDAIRAVVEVEVVHVLRAEEDLQRVRDLAERHAERQRALPIDRDLKLRIVGGERAEQARSVGD